MVVLVGVTGAGKTTFASVASDQKDLGIGDGLDPCTRDPHAVHFTLDGRPVVLNDTPGFDDTVRTDIEILEGIGKWVAKQGFTKSQPLDGLILLHPIYVTHEFDSSMERKRIRLLESILGKDAYKRVVIATTMWGTLTCEDDVKRDIDARWHKGVWDSFRKGGATITEHDNTSESAHRIIRSIIKRSDESERVEILLQKEMAKKSARFIETSAGKEVKGNLENEIRLIEDQLLDHRNQRPPDSYRKSRNTLERWKWKEWEDEYNDLNKNLELRQVQLKRLNSFIVSSIQQSLISSLHPSVLTFPPSSRLHKFGLGCLGSSRNIRPH